MTASHHVFSRSPDAIESPFQANINCQIPLGIGHLVNQGIPGEPGVINQNVYCTEFLSRHVHNLLAIFRFRDITGTSLCPTTSRLYFLNPLLEWLFIDIAD